jgi:hypothetical protein
MKNQTKFGKYFLSAFIVTLLACNTEVVDDELKADLVSTPESYLYDGGGETVTDKVILELIKKLNIDAGSVKKKLLSNPDGSAEEGIIIGGDIGITNSELLEMSSKLDVMNQNKQYRGPNLVSSANRSIDILGLTGGNQGLSTKAQTALRNAVNNYNRLANSTIRFNLTFNSTQSAIDNAEMVVFDDSRNNTGSGGRAVFPTSDGRPGKNVRIFNIENFTTDVNEHVITHEMGHAVGLRHSDWFDRLSCPANFRGAESQATLIPGTPSGRDLTSIMQACFPSNSNGEFNSNDVIALETIY